MRTLYPEIEPFDTGILQVDDRHAVSGHGLYEVGDVGIEPTIGQALLHLVGLE